ARTGEPAVSPPIGVDPEITVAANALFEGIAPEDIWACAACKACDEICPVNIEVLEKVLDMRRYLSLVEANLATQRGTQPRAEKVDGVPVIEPGDTFDHEYLYWVGCAGSFDDKNQRVSVAMAKLMQRAGLDFAILGPSENCTGDPARRSGNEYIFQMLAMQN